MKLLKESWWWNWQAALLDTKMRPDEFFRRNRLGFVAGGFERGEMRVARHDKIRCRRDGAVVKFVVVRVLRDDREPEPRFNLPDVAVQPVEQFQQGDNLPLAFRAGQFCRDFLVFEQNFVGHRQCQPAIQQGAEDRVTGLFPPEDLEKDVGVEADRHA